MRDRCELIQVQTMRQAFHQYVMFNLISQSCLSLPIAFFGVGLFITLELFTINRYKYYNSEICTTSVVLLSVKRKQTPLQTYGSFNFIRLSLPPANEVWGKVIFSVACVKNSVHRGGLPQCMLGYPLEQTPPPGTRHHPCTVHAGRYGQQAGGMHPTGMQSCFHMILVIWTEHHVIILSMPPSPIPTQIWDHHCTINSADPSKPDGTMT